MLGVTPQDTPETITTAYDLQVACDPGQTKLYLSALEAIAEKAQVTGQEALQMKVATERSMDRYTTGEPLRPSKSRGGITDKRRC